MIPHKQLSWNEVLGNCEEKLDDSYGPYNAAYGAMPSHDAANPAIQQIYLNGHFCYSFKFGIVTNGLGIVRDITFYNKNFLKAHPDIAVKKKTDLPEWAFTYKVRAVVEKATNHFKDCFCLEDLKTQNEKTIHSDLLCAGISPLITVLVADKIHERRFSRSLKPRAAEALFISLFLLLLKGLFWCDFFELLPNFQLFSITCDAFAFFWFHFAID